MIFIFTIHNFDISIETLFTQQQELDSMKEIVNLSAPYNRREANIVLINRI